MTTFGLLILLPLVTAFAVSALIDILRADTRFWRDKPTWGSDSLPSELRAQFKASFTRYFLSRRYLQRNLLRDALILLLGIGVGTGLLLSSGPPISSESDDLWVHSLNVIVILGFLLAAWLFYVAGSRRNRSDESRPKTDPSKPEQPGPPKRTSVRVAQLAKSILSFGKLLSVDKFLSFGSLFGALIGTVNLDVHDLAKLQATAMVPISLSGSLVNYAPSTTPQNISIRLQSASAGTIAVDCNINDRKAELTPRYTVRFTANSDDPQDEKDNLRKNVERIVDAIVVAKGSKNLTGLLLIGSADKRPLLEPLRKIYGSNEGLAQKRITVTRDALQMEFQKRNLKFPDTVIDAISGPSIYDGNRDDMAPDRSVRVCRFWS